MTPPTEYKNLPIRKYSAAVRGASGDALNGALKVAPQDFRNGDPAYLLLEVAPNGDQHKPMDDGEAWEHVEVVKVVRGAFIGAKDALPHLDAVSVKLEDIRVKETGQERLDVETRMADDHRAGLHKRARKNCELCQSADPLGVHGDPTPIGKHAQTVADMARAAAEKEQGEGDPDNPLPPARRYRTKKGAAKTTRKKPPRATSTKT